MRRGPKAQKKAEDVDLHFLWLGQCVCVCVCVIHGPDRCRVQLALSLISPVARTALSFTIAQIISVLTAQPSVTAT